VALALLAAHQAGAQDESGTLPQLRPDYHKTSHKVVLITDQSLSPREVEIEQGQLVAWISYSKAASQIVFEREIAKNMICHSLVNFTLVDDELKSALIYAGEFASFCELTPGRYKYKVIRHSTPNSGVGAASRRLEGEIIVGKPS
jgi:hypothetical protein